MPDRRYPKTEIQSEGHIQQILNEILEWMEIDATVEHSRCPVVQMHIIHLASTIATECSQI